MIKWFKDGKQLAEKDKTLTRVGKDVVNAHFSCNISNTIGTEISLPVQQICYKPGKYYLLSALQTFKFAFFQMFVSSYHNKILFFFSCFIPEVFSERIFGISIWVLVGGGAGMLCLLCNPYILTCVALLKCN